jgi:hypothetical protein
LDLESYWKSHFRKSKLKEDEEEEEDAKIPKKEIQSNSPASSSSSPKPSLLTAKIEKEENDCWYQLEDGGQIKDLLPSGIIKNSSSLRFEVKEISLSEDV